MTTHNSRGVIGINIQPITRNVKKIILGAPIIPKTATRLDTEALNDYTRFVPLTSFPDTDITADVDLNEAEVPKILLKKNSKIRSNTLWKGADSIREGANIIAIYNKQFLFSFL